MKAIIIDDERLARSELRKLLQDFPEIEVVDEELMLMKEFLKLKIIIPILFFWISRCRGKRGLTYCPNWIGHRT